MKTTYAPKTHRTITVKHTQDALSAVWRAPLLCPLPPSNCEVDRRCWQSHLHRGVFQTHCRCWPVTKCRVRGRATTGPARAWAACRYRRPTTLPRPRSHRSRASYGRPSAVAATWSDGHRCVETSDCWHHRPLDLCRSFHRRCPIQGTHT